LPKLIQARLNYASIGLGTQSHLGMELLRIMTGIDINQVSYRGHPRPQ